MTEVIPSYCQLTTCTYFNQICIRSQICMMTVFNQGLPSLMGLENCVSLTMLRICCMMPGRASTQHSTYRYCTLGIFLDCALGHTSLDEKL